MPKKQVEDFRRIEITVVSRVKTKEDSATRFKMTLQIGDKEIPFSGPPTPREFAAAVESGRERSNEIEFASQIGQRLQHLDPVNNALDPEEFDQVIEDRHSWNIEPETAMTAGLRHKKEKSRPASDVQNILRRGPVEVEILDPPDVDPEPFFQIEVFRIMPPTFRRVRGRGTVPFL